MSGLSLHFLLLDYHINTVALEDFSDEAAVAGVVITTITQELDSLPSVATFFQRLEGGDGFWVIDYTIQEAWCVVVIERFLIPHSVVRQLAIVPEQFLFGTEHSKLGDTRNGTFIRPHDSVNAIEVSEVGVTNRVSLNHDNPFSETDYPFQ